jgi:hypothetical protein
MFTSCLKEKNDFGGTREDNGQVLTSILEKDYQLGDDYNSGNGWVIFSFFNFTAHPAEQVKFFTLHVTQPRATKMTGPMTVKVTMSPLAGTDAFPAGAVTIQDVVIPQSSADVFDYPVKFTVNKTLLNATKAYGATFKITSVSQGVFSANSSSVDVYINYDGSFNTSEWTSVFIRTTTVQDPSNQIGHTNNSARVLVEEYAPNKLDVASAMYGYPLRTVNRVTGAFFNLLYPQFDLNSSGVITAVRDGSGVIPTITLESTSTNKYVYTANDQRTIDVKYSFNYTSLVNGTSVTRKITVTESYIIEPLGAFY